MPGPAYTGYEPPSPGAFVSPDYADSYQEWMYRVVASLSGRYARGDQGLLDNLSGATGSIGQPYQGDFGKGTESAQTRTFWENYAKTYGASDPYILGQFGAPPGRSATY